MSNSKRCEMCMVHGTYSYDKKYWTAKVKLQKGGTKDMVLCNSCARYLEKVNIASNLRRLNKR